MHSMRMRRMWLPALVAVLAAVVAVQSAALVRLSKRLAASEAETAGKPAATLTKADPQDVPNPPQPTAPIQPVAPKDPGASDPFARLHELRLDPFVEMQRMEQRMNELFNRAFAAPRSLGPGLLLDEGLGGFAGGRAEIQEANDSYVVRMKVPDDGRSSKIDVRVDDRVLTISGRHDAASEDQRKDGGVRQQRSSGSFAQSITLPGPVDASRMKTKMEDGTLTVTLPKRTEGRTISTGTIT